eukprot:RCo037567
MVRVYVSNIPFDTPLPQLCEALPAQKLAAVQIYKEALPYKFGYLEFRAADDAAALLSSTIVVGGQTLHFQPEHALNKGTLSDVPQGDKLRAFLCSRVVEGVVSADFTAAEQRFLHAHLPEPLRTLLGPAPECWARLLSDLFSSSPVRVVGSSTVAS